MTRAGQHLNPRQVKGGFTPLQKNSTFAGIPSSTSSSSTVGRPTNAPALMRSSSALEQPNAAETFKPLSKTASFSSAGRRGFADASSAGPGSSSGAVGGGAKGFAASGGSMEAAAAAVTSGGTAGGVKRGAAGSFDPSVFSSRGGEGGADQRGVFVPRSDMDERQYAFIEKV
jgi:hypothetical protein